MLLFFMYRRKFRTLLDEIEKTEELIIKYYDLIDDSEFERGFLEGLKSMAYESQKFFFTRRHIYRNAFAYCDYVRQLTSEIEKARNEPCEDAQIKIAL